MSLKSALPLVLLLFLQFVPAQEKKMCITVDDLPTVPYGINEPDFQLDLTQKIVAVFTTHQIPAIGYVNEGKLYENDKVDAQRVQLLDLWLKSGLELGNHTRSHLNYHEVAFGTYTKDILQGEQLIKELAKKYGSQVRYFRHPYLRSGRNKAHADSLKTFLEQNGYTEAPVTIDNEDYLFAKAYSKAYQKQDKELMDSIGRTYVDYMEQKLVFYEGLSQKLFGRNMQQTLLIHASLLNAHFLEELIKMYRAHSYSFVSQTEILTDPAYREEVSRFGDWGISWIDRWALGKGKKGDFFKGDPETPAFILELQ